MVPTRKHTTITTMRDPPAAAIGHSMERGSTAAAGLYTTAGRSIINEKHGKIDKE